MKTTARIRRALQGAAPLSGVTLRDYQREAALKVLDEVAAGHRRVLLVAPTGSGKTIMFSALAAAFHATGHRVLVVAHRRELIAQAVEKLHASGIADVGTYRGARNAKARDAAVQVAAIQALKPGLLDADLVIVDEAHHAPAESYMVLLEMYPDAVHVGATATPWWGTGKGLGDYFQAAVIATTVRELTDAGHLARVRMFTHPHTLDNLDLRGVKVSDGDYTIASVSERVDRPALLGDIAEHWKTHAGGARTLAFAASVEHSRHIVERFRAAGIEAEHVDGATPADERAAILARLRSGETRVVSNYNVLTEGFDEPAVGCVILARPTRRAGVYLQAMGRGMRADEGKASLVVLDHAGGCLMHGFVDEERGVNLDGIAPSRGGGVPLRRCPACGLCVPLSTMVCPECSVTLREGVLTEEPSGVLVEAREALARRDALAFNGETMTLAAWGLRTGIPLSTLYRRADDGLPADKVLAPARGPARDLTHDGRTQSVASWARELGLKQSTIYARLRRGASVQESLAPEVRAPTVTHDGRTQTVSEWSKELGIPTNTINNRLRKGLPAHEVLAPSPRERSVVVGGRSLSILALAKESGINARTMAGRVQRGVAGEALVARRVRGSEPSVLLTHDGKTLSISAWASQLGISKQEIYRRLARGASAEDALAPPKRKRRPDDPDGAPA